MLRIMLFIVSIGLGSILFLVKPSIATGAFFIFCLGGVEAPATYLDGIIPQPWRPDLTLDRSDDPRLSSAPRCWCSPSA